MCTLCSRKSQFVVNGLRREAQAHVCATHLARVVRELAEFNDPRYKRRHPDDKQAGTVYLIKTA